MLPRLAVGLTVLICVACRGTRNYQPRPESRAPALTYESILGPVSRSSHRELRALEAIDEQPAARLRTAHVLLSSLQTDRALSELNVLLYGPVQHGPSVESFARFLRAQAFEKRGELDRARQERELAKACAVDPRLRSELEKLSPKPAAAGPSVADVRVIPRDRWNARAPDTRSMTRMSAIHRITIHHSANLTRQRNERAVVAALQAIQRYHMDERKWSDVAYHYLIDPAGRVWQGRETNWQGAHSGRENNPGNLGICLLGNFLRKQQEPTEAQTRALEGLLHRLLDHHGLNAQAIRTHSELKTTSCPGENLQAVVDRLRGFTVASSD